MRKAMALVCLLLCACSVQIVDKRLTREEVTSALQERDRALMVLAERLKSLEDKKNDKKSH